MYQPGNVVRDNSVTITTNQLGIMYNRSSATANFAATSPLVAGSVLGCRGDTGALGAVGTGNNSPRTTVTVTGPGGITVLPVTEAPVIDVSIGGAIGGYPPLAVQPAPAATNYRGGAFGSTVTGAPVAPNTRPMVNTIDLTGKPAGVYTVTTVTKNIFRNTSISACAIGTPVVGSNAAAVPGLQTDTKTFEYRPWQRVFEDVLNNGRVNVNITPSEFQAAITGGPTGSIWDDQGPTMRFYNAPGASSLMLPGDPAACAGNPQSCLPSTALECTPGVAGCNPRFLIINKQAPGDEVRGIFDLSSGVFIAVVNVNGSQRLLFSLGSGDNIYRNLLTQLNDLATAQGINLMSILGTTVRVRLGATEYKINLLNGLQIDPKPGGAANGVQIVADYSAQAGLILNIFSSLGGAQCVGGSSGDSDPATAAPDRYTHVSDAGYTVEKSDLLPEVPRVGAVGALVGGPIYHIEGDFVGAAATLVNTSSAVIGVDTSENEPNGYPVWLPLLSGVHVENARTMDFIGTATWLASETDVPTLGCLTVDFMLGAGVAIFNNPLPIGFGDIPIWDPQSAEVQALMAQVNAAVQDVVNQVTTNPTVADLLEQLTGALPPVEGVPLP